MLLWYLSILPCDHILLVVIKNLPFELVHDWGIISLCVCRREHKKTLCMYSIQEAIFKFWNKFREYIGFTVMVSESCIYHGINVSHIYLYVYIFFSIYQKR